MSAPVIAVSADRRPLGPAGSSGRVRPGRPEVFVREAVIEAIRAAGGAPFLLPPDERPSESWLDWVMTVSQGVVITGGSVDLHPRHYGQVVLARQDGADEGRAALELGLARAALARGLPILGVCGGMQVMAVAGGGTLCQDIQTFMPGAGQHEQPTDPATPWHEVLLETPAARAIFGADRIAVNSTHHMTVDDPGAFEIVGRAPDGVVEVILHPRHPFALGVEWHPELLAPPAQADGWAPYRALLRACSK